MIFFFFVCACVFLGLENAGRDEISQRGGAAGKEGCPGCGGFPGVGMGAGL